MRQWQLGNGLLCILLQRQLFTSMVLGKDRVDNTYVTVHASFPNAPAVFFSVYVISYFKAGTIFSSDHVCHPNPCLHGGACKVVDHPMGSRNNRWNYHCSCSEWYRGRICHSKWLSMKRTKGTPTVKDQHEKRQVERCSPIGC